MAIKSNNINSSHANSYFSNTMISIAQTDSPAKYLIVGGNSPHPTFGVKSVNSNKYPHGVIELKYGYSSDNDFINATKDVVINSYGDSYFNGGNVGIGSTSPDSILTVNGREIDLLMSRQLI